MTEIERVKEFFKGDVFATSQTGIEIVEIGEMWARCRLDLDSRHKNAGNQVMGGVIFTLADFTFAVATNRGEAITVTTSSNISFLKGTRGNTLFAEAKLLKNGKKNCFFEVSVTDEKGELIALATTVGTHL